MDWGRGMNFAMGTVPECGAIFMSNNETGKECLRRRLFGLPSSQHSFVAQVKAGMILFLFEYESRQLYGVFQACSDGAMNIVPHAFSASGKQFPAQVKMKPLWNCAPLSENVFRDIIKKNYFTAKKFNFGLSEEQVRGLVSLFGRRILKANMPRKQILEFREDDEFESTSAEKWNEYQQVSGCEADTNQVEYMGHYRKLNDIESFAEHDHLESEPPLGGKVSSYSLDCNLQDIADNVRSTGQDTEDFRAISVVNTEASLIHAANYSSSGVSEKYLPEDNEAPAWVRLGRGCYAPECSGLGIGEARLTKSSSFEMPASYCPSCSFNIRGNSSARCFDDRLTNTCLQESEAPIKWSSETLPSGNIQWNIPRSPKYSPMSSSSCTHCVANGRFHGGDNKQFNPQMSNVQVQCLPGCTGFAHCVPQKRKRNSVFSRLSGPVGKDIESMNKSDHRDSSNITSMLHHQRHCFAESANDILTGMTNQSELATVQPIMWKDSTVCGSASFDISHASDGKSDSGNMVDTTPLHDFRRRSQIRKHQVASVLKSSENPPSSVGTLVGPSGRRKLIRPDFSKKEALEQKSIDDDFSKSCPTGSFDTGSAIKDVDDDFIALEVSEDVKDLSMSGEVLSQLAILDKESGTIESLGGKCNDQDTVDLHGNEEPKLNQVIPILEQENGVCIGVQKKANEIQETPNFENAGAIESCEHDSFLLKQSTSPIALTANNRSHELPVVELEACCGHEDSLITELAIDGPYPEATKEPVGIVTHDGERNELVSIDDSLLLEQSASPVVLTVSNSSLELQVAEFEACGGHDTLVTELVIDSTTPASIDGPSPEARKEPLSVVLHDGKGNQLLSDGTDCELYPKVDQDIIDANLPVLPETECEGNKDVDVLPGNTVGADVEVGMVEMTSPGSIKHDVKGNELPLDGTGCELCSKVNQDMIDVDFLVLPETDREGNKAINVLHGGQLGLMSNSAWSK